MGYANRDLQEKTSRLYGGGGQIPAETTTLPRWWSGSNAHGQAGGHQRQSSVESQEEEELLLNLSRNNYNFLFQTAIIKVTIINYHRFNLEAITKVSSPMTDRRKRRDNQLTLFNLFVYNHHRHPVLITNYLPLTVYYKYMRKSYLPISDGPVIKIPLSMPKQKECLVWTMDSLGIHD